MKRRMPSLTEIVVILMIIGIIASIIFIRITGK